MQSLPFSTRLILSLIHICNEIDFAFSPKQPYGFSSLESLDVFHDKMSLCVSKTFPLAQKDSADTQDLSDLPLALLGVPVAGFERVLKTRSIYICLLYTSRGGHGA